MRQDQSGTWQRCQNGCCCFRQSRPGWQLSPACHLPSGRWSLQTRCHHFWGEKKKITERKILTNLTATLTIFPCGWHFPVKGMKKVSVFGKQALSYFAWACMSAVTNVKPTLHSVWPQLTTLAADWKGQARRGTQQETGLTMWPPLLLSLSFFLSQSDTTSLCLFTEALHARPILTPPHLQYSKSHHTSAKITARHLGARHVAKWATS